MKNFIFGCSLLFLHFAISLAGKKFINVSEIVELVNKNKDLPWKADSYGQKKIDLDLFAKTKLGIKHEKKYDPPYKRLSQKNVLRKATFRPVDTDYMGLPVNFTWANNNNTKCPVDRIRDQSNCGSCWAVATVAALGDRYCIQGKSNKTFSHEHLIACNSLNYGCWGGYIAKANRFLVENGTITGGEYESDEGCQPYSVRPCGFPRASAMSCAYGHSVNPKCKKRRCSNDWYTYQSEPDSNVFKAKSWDWIRSNNTHSVEDCMRDEIYRNGPVTAYFYVLSDFLTYKKGVYVPIKPRSWNVGVHAVRVVGWGVENRLKYWHAANSWGTGWGEKGFFKFIRGVDMLIFESNGCQPYSIRPCGFPRHCRMPCDYDESFNPKCKKRKCNNDWYQYKSEPDSNVFKAQNWSSIESNYTHSREDCIREEIYKNGPITTLFYVLEDFMFYKSGVYVPRPRSKYLGGHAVRIVGWGVENGLKYWHAVNSWSEHWGENGFFKFIRGVDACWFEYYTSAFTLPQKSNA